MFKRVAKRQRKREKEEDLGLDEDLKQVLGLQDTDSDESMDSSSGSESGSDFEDDDDPDMPESKRKHSAKNDDQNDSLAGEEEEEDMELVSYMESDDGTDEIEDDSPPMDVMTATTDPIYDIPGAPAAQDLRACIVCPGKLLKHSQMVKVHLESSAHLRRLQRYKDNVEKLNYSPEGLTTDDPRAILRAMANPSGLDFRDKNNVSKRSQRKMERKLKRQGRKRLRKEKKAIAVEKKVEDLEAPRGAIGGSLSLKKRQPNDAGKKGASVEESNPLKKRGFDANANGQKDSRQVRKKRKTTLGL